VLRAPPLVRSTPVSTIFSSALLVPTPCDFTSIVVVPALVVKCRKSVRFPLGWKAL
jgi:hypothetical protein